MSYASPMCHKLQLILGLLFIVRAKHLNSRMNYISLSSLSNKNNE